MGMVIRKRIRLLTAWILAAALCCMAIGSEALAATGSRAWGRRPSLGTYSPSRGTQAQKPVMRPFAGDPDVPQGSPQGSTKDGSSPSGAQLPYWQQLLQGLLPLLGGQRLP